MEREGKELTMDYIKSVMEDSYTLVWVDYCDNPDDNLDVIEECLRDKCAMTLYNKADEWFREALWRNVREIWRQIESDCMDDGFDWEAVHAFMEDNRDDIIGIIYERNDSDAVKDLIKNTNDIPVRIEMLSNYDCINSHWLESQGGYVYPGSYFGDMVDALNLNPAKVKSLLADKGIRVYGRCPDRKSRNGKEQVSYEDFHRELVNSCCGGNLLTYIGKINPKELLDYGFSVTKVTVPKGNHCGIFSSMYGGGSVLDMELREDVTLELKTENYHGYRLVIDNPQKKYDYSIRQVYSVGDSFFDEIVKLTPATQETA